MQGALHFSRCQYLQESTELASLCWNVLDPSKAESVQAKGQLWLCLWGQTVTVYGLEDHQSSGSIKQTPTYSHVGKVNRDIRSTGNGVFSTGQQTQNPSSTTETRSVSKTFHIRFQVGFGFCFKKAPTAEWTPSSRKYWPRDPHILNKLPKSDCWDIAVYGKEGCLLQEGMPKMCVLMTHEEWEQASGTLSILMKSQQIQSRINTFWPLVALCLFLKGTWIQASPQIQAPVIKISWHSGACATATPHLQWPQFRASGNY